MECVGLCSWLNRTNKPKLIVYLVATICLAYLISRLVGHSYDASSFRKLRGEPRKVRQAPLVADQQQQQQQVSDKLTSSGANQQQQQQQAAGIDPFAGRPRIQTKNGHLIIEAGVDKNIDFRTSGGSRGSLTLNGHRLDQLLGLVGALERSAQGAQGAPGPLRGLFSNTTHMPASVVDQYELVLRSLLGSSKKLASLQASHDDLRKRLSSLSKRVKKLTQRLGDAAGELKRQQDKQTELAGKLKQNNCFDPNSGQPVCKNGATCVNAYDGFKCICPDTFEGPTCEQDVDECLKFRGTDLGCQNGGKCVNLAGGYRCECPAQYHGVHCTTLHDDCQLSSSSALCGHGKCVNLARTEPNRPAYECVCDQGWTSDGKNPACVIDINECLAGATIYSASSLGNSSSATATLEQLMAPHYANAAYPCSQNPYVECINLPGSFQCAPCPAGYTGNGRLCRDIDECAVAGTNGGCSLDPLVDCINLPGSRRCGPCPAGYTGDGQYCVPRAACSPGTCHPLARCLELGPAVANADSSHLCICQYPYTGPGTGPAGCWLPGGGAGGGQASAQLVPAMGPSLGSLDGLANYTDLLSNISMQLGVQDDCSPSPCLNGAQCERLDGGFECICPAGWSGRLCDERADYSCGGRFHTSQGLFVFPVDNSYEQLIRLASAKQAGQYGNANAQLAGKTEEPKQRQQQQSGGPARPEYRCVWSMAVAGNMSLKLTFNNLTLKPGGASASSKQLQVYLFNQSASGAATHYGWPARPVGPPDNCLEELTVRERLDPALEALGAQGAQLAKVCVKAGTPLATGPLGRQWTGGPLELVAESNLVDLEYAYYSARVRSPSDTKPSLAFQLSWSKTVPPCGGELPALDSGSISSPKFPDFYPAGTECRYLLRAPPGKRIRLQIGELTLLTGRPQSGLCADSLTILDGAISLDRPVLFQYCANNHTRLAGRLSPSDPSGQPALLSRPIVSSSSSVTVLLSSRPESSAPLLRPKQRRGFYLTYASEPATPGCGGLYTAKSALVKSLDYEPGGATGQFQWWSVDERASSELATEYSRYFDSTSRGQQWAGNYYHQLLGLAAPQPQQPASKQQATSASQRDPPPPPPPAADDPGADQWARKWKPSSRALAGKLADYKTRCEFEIRPADQARNHRVQLDWLEMPSETLTEPSSLTRWSRQFRCARSRLTIYNRDPSSVAGPLGADDADADADQSVVAQFCSGDKYNASLAQAIPIASMGHVLHLVYESSYTIGSNNNNNNTAGSGGGGLASKPAGFKLHYSTICSAIYRQLEGRIRTELDFDTGDSAGGVDECIYHIMLPPNNTMSLVVEPPVQSSSLQAGGGGGGDPLVLPDGSCAAQAILMDGAMPRGRLALAQTERQLKSFSLASLAASASILSGSPSSVPFPELADLFGQQQQQQQLNYLESTENAPDLNETAGASSTSRATGGQQQQQPLQDESSSSSSSYWQYGSSQAHDIKEFDVCKLPALGIDSMWNHMSLLFRLAPDWRRRAAKPEPSDDGQLDGAAADSAPKTTADQVPNRPGGSAGRRPFQLTIRYRAEPSCGGIITAPREGSIRLVSRRPIKSIAGYPLTVGRFEQVHRQQFINHCSWILRNPRPGQLIQLTFDQVPVEAIRRRKSDWIAWRRRRLANKSPAASGNATSSSSGSGSGDTLLADAEPTGNSPDGTSNELELARSLEHAAVCRQIYAELIELYEPSLNRTRFICPSDLVESTAAGSGGAGGQRSWTTQSDTIFIRLLNQTDSRLLLQQATGATAGQQQHAGPSPSSSNNNSTTTTTKTSPTPDSGWPDRWKPLTSDGGGDHSHSHPPLALNYVMLSERSRPRSCGGKLIQSSGLIQSPRFPFNYPSNIDCVWVLQSERAQQQVRLNFTKFELENQSNCWFDYLEIRNGPDESSPLMGRFCNRDLEGRVLVSHSNQVWLHFRSDAHLQRPGFQLYFDGAQTGCGGVLTAPSGQIDSPNYPYAYGHGATCEWTIEVSQANRIQLSIVDLDLTTTGTPAPVGGSAAAPSPLGTNSRCQPGKTGTNGLDYSDYLEIFDSGPEVPSRSFGKLCHLGPDKRPLVLNSTSNKLYIVYKAQPLDYSRGFRLTYTSLCSGVQLLGTSGAIESPGYPNAYLPSMSCSYLLRAPLGSNLSLVLTDLELEAGGVGGGGGPMQDQLKPASGLDSSSGSSKKPTKPRRLICSTDLLRIWSVRPKAETPLARRLGLAGGISLPEEMRLSKLSKLKSWMTANNTSNNATSDQHFDFVLERNLCGQLDQLDQADRQLSLATNLAIVEFRTDRALELRGFRLEWRAQGCGRSQRFGGQQGATATGAADELAASYRLEPINFDERLDLAYYLLRQQPVECLWLLDYSQKSRLVELELSSDMRSPDHVAGGSSSSSSLASSTSDIVDDCTNIVGQSVGGGGGGASLVVYDGPDLGAPVLTSNCNQKRRHETLYATSNRILVRFFSDGKQSYGRNFQLVSLPATAGNRDDSECSQSQLELSTPYLELAGTRRSPNYPDLYDSRPYKCTGLISSALSGRLRFTIDELDIPVSGGGGGGQLARDGSSDLADTTAPAALGFADPEVCERSGNYLQIKSVSSSNSPVSEFFCGKFYRTPQLSSTGDGGGGGQLTPSAAADLKRSTIVLEQHTAWLDFATRGQTQGKWKVSFDRLCGATIRSIHLQAEEFSSYNYPSRPAWPKRGAASDRNTESYTEQVCIWRLISTPQFLDSGYNSQQQQQQQQQRKLHFNLVNFIESDRLQDGWPSDCLRVYEGAEGLNLRQDHYNLTDLDARLQPKLKICKQSDLKHSSLYYVSRGSELIVLITGNTIAKFRIKPYENYCGGDYLFREAEFGSPDYPQPYGPDLDCHYFVSAPAGATINLLFQDWNLRDRAKLAGPAEPAAAAVDSSDSSDSSAATGATSDPCELMDHIELRQMTVRSRVQLRLKSYMMRQGRSGANPMDQSGSPGAILRWFNQQQQQQAGQVDAGPPQNRTSVSRSSTVETVGRLFELARLFAIMDENANDPYGDSEGRKSGRVRGLNSRLAIRLEEFYAHSTLVGRYCASRPPPGITATGQLQFQDELLVRFRSHSGQGNYVKGATLASGKARLANRQEAPKFGFLASYRIQYGGTIVMPTRRGDDEEETIGYDQYYYLSSPMYPQLYQSNETIEWKIVAPVGCNQQCVLQFELVSLTLGSGRLDCQDSLQVYDGFGPNSQLLSHLCGHLSFKRSLHQDTSQYWLGALSGSTNPRRLPIVYSAFDPKIKIDLLRPVRTTRPVATVIYDNLSQRGGFMLRYRALSLQELGGATSSSSGEASGANGSVSSSTSSSTSSSSDWLDPLMRPLSEDEALRDQLGLEADIGGYQASSGGPAAKASKFCSKIVQLRQRFVDVAGIGRSASVAGPQANLTDSVDLMSPDYPNETSEANIECHWLVYTHDNTNIKLTIDPSTSSLFQQQQQQQDSAGSDYEADTRQTSSGRADDCFRRVGGEGGTTSAGRTFVVVHDGASLLAPVLARYCLPAPPIQLQSSDNHLLIRYVHASSPSPPPPSRATRWWSSSLFKATARLSQCGGQYRILFPTTIRDRNANSMSGPERATGGPSSYYANNLDCLYYVFASSPDKVLVVMSQLSQLDLAASPTNADCSVGDYIEIRDLPLTSASLLQDYPSIGDQAYGSFSPSAAATTSSSGGRLVGRFCAGNPLPANSHIESPGSAMTIRLHTDETNVASGFSLFVTQDEPRFSCPRSYLTLNLDEPYGRLSSPNWPYGFTGKRQCRYNLVTPQNQSIELTFVRLRRPELPAADETTGSSGGGGTKSLTGGPGPANRCADSLHYLADNEAETLRYDWRPLRDLRSASSGQPFGRLIRELACKLGPGGQSKYSLSVDDTKNPLLNNGGPQAALVQQQPQQQRSTGPARQPGSLAKLSADDYGRLYDLAPSNPYTIKTRSYALTLEYSAKNLLPNEGFLAIYKLVDLDEGHRCGGDVWPELGRNTLQSARFNQLMKRSSLAGSAPNDGQNGQDDYGGDDDDDDEDYIQCKWTLKLDSSSYDYMVSFGARFEASPYHLVATSELGYFKTSFLAFQVLEVPAMRDNFSLADEEWSSSARGPTARGGRELCGLNKLEVSGNFAAYHALLACGNLTGQYKWMFVNDASTHVTLRTKNWPLRQAPTGGSGSGSGTAAPFYRGLRAHLHESSCLRAEQLVGESLRIRSHGSYNASQLAQQQVSLRYKPSICRWHLKLQPGHYEIHLLGLNFRRAQVSGQQEGADKSAACSDEQLKRDDSLDYLELRASAGPAAPVLVRYCAHNQLAALKRHTYELNATGELVVVSVLGLDQLLANSNNNRDLVQSSEQAPALPSDQQKQLGFELIITRVRNSTMDKFCQVTGGGGGGSSAASPSIYKLIRNRERTYYMWDYLDQLAPTFLYPKNVHCEVELSLAEELRFNLSFVDLFDMEPSPNCTNDYVQIDDLLEPWQPGDEGTGVAVASSNKTASAGPQGKSSRATTTTTTPRPKQPAKTTTVGQTVQQPAATGLREDLSQRASPFRTKLIGRWCGRRLPRGSFVSSSNNIRITFHSNQQIEGKGFLLEWASVRTSGGGGGPTDGTA